MRKTPLDDWIAARIGAPLTPENLTRRQFSRLRKTLALAAAKSPFYRKRLAGVDPQAIQCPADLARLPLTTQEDVRERGPDFLCVSQGEIARIATLESSGTTGTPKRLYFTAEDLEATMDFFHHGMTTFAAPGDKVLILMPGARPGGVGDLLAKALQRSGASGHVHDLSLSAGQTLDVIEDGGFSVMVCLPIQALALARAAKRLGRPRLLKHVLVSADYAAESLLHALERNLCEQAYAHWGMTETGLGGGVECPARQGCHLREADLLVEIIDPATGASLPDGETGEIVVSTLTRIGMPLIRYRTGDLARIIAAPCPCGSGLRRLGGFRGRLADRAPLPGGESLSMAELDEALFPIPGLLDFSAVLRQDRDEHILDIAARFESEAEDGLRAAKLAAKSLLASKNSSAVVRVRPAPHDAQPLARLAKRTLNIMGGA
jgi:phenylacetate-CoA ligase